VGNEGQSDECGNADKEKMNSVHEISLEFFHIIFVSSNAGKEENDMDGNKDIEHSINSIPIACERTKETKEENTAEGSDREEQHVERTSRVRAFERAEKGKCTCKTIKDSYTDKDRKEDKEPVEGLFVVGKEHIIDKQTHSGIDTNISKNEEYTIQGLCCGGRDDWIICIFTNSFKWHVEQACYTRRCCSSAASDHE